MTLWDAEKLQYPPGCFDPDQALEVLKESAFSPLILPCRSSEEEGGHFTFSVGSGIETAHGDGMQNGNRINSSERSSCAQTTVL